ncbi:MULTISPECIES: bifunctional riboflavin kinase/FAD synthetase [unclassified Chromohalobacter]|uniref:bifunctional riboflavin kinase/FAD synthetase n=1 Tax=unclassified Chromohalobacter TaxID=2628571 RepID=UPI0024697312|nr:MULTISPECIES: bifunctional riboflavin kinase/FAD synthetase [unclassified Chromohalobacter]
MELIRGLHNLREAGPCVATIGNFDGVHRGHQAILDQLKSRATALGLPMTVVVFEPQPREYFAGEQAPPRLSRLRDKVELLAEYGAERIVCLPFNAALRGLTADEFIERVLIRGLGVKHLVVGDDFRFGCDRAGDFALLQRVGERRGFEVEHTRTFVLDDDRVSSTRVRTLLASGNFAQAARLLGRPYQLSGRVVADRQLGRTIGVPTANLPLTSRSLALRGIYACVTRLPDGRELPGAANIGWRPTVGSSRPVLEVHLFDFEDDLYGQRLTVVPCARLRGEVNFAGLEALTRQIHADLAQARRYFRTATPLDAAALELPCASTGWTYPLASAPLAPEPSTSDSSAGARPADQDDG